MLQIDKAHADVARSRTKARLSYAPLLAWACANVLGSLNHIAILGSLPLCCLLERCVKTDSQFDEDQALLHIIPADNIRTQVRWNNVIREDVGTQVGRDSGGWGNK